MRGLKRRRGPEIERSANEPAAEQKKKKDPLPRPPHHKDEAICFALAIPGRVPARNTRL